MWRMCDYVESIKNETKNQKREQKIQKKKKIRQQLIISNLIFL